MKQNCHQNQWFKTNFFLPSRNVFEEKKSESDMTKAEEDGAKTIESFEVEALAKADQNPRKPTPETKRSHEIQATKEVRQAIAKELPDIDEENEDEGVMADRFGTQINVDTTDSKAETLRSEQLIEAIEAPAKTLDSNGIKAFMKGFEAQKNADVVVETREAAEESLKETVERQKKKIAELREDNEIKGEQLEKLDQDNADLWGEKEDLWDEKKEALGENDRLRSDLMEEQVENDGLLTKNDRLEKHVVELRIHNAQLAAEKEDAKKEKGKMKERIIELENKDDSNNVKIERLEHEVISDALTGLNNRRFYDTMLPKVISKVVRNGGNLSVLMVDLDMFKLVNDQLGHEGGDEALRLVGKIIEETFRPEDIKCRYGGEELVIVLSDTDSDKAMIAAERLRKAIEDQLKPYLREKYEEEKGKEAIDSQMGTVSIGVSSYQNLGGKLEIENNETEDRESLKRRKQGVIKKATELIPKQADTALYYSKKNGRNQISAYDPSMGIREEEAGEEEKVGVKKGLNKDLGGAAMESETLDQYTKRIIEQARIIPEDQREMALRRAADEVRAELKIQAI